MSTGKRRFSAWPVVVALLAGIGIGLWSGLAVRESQQAEPGEPAASVVRRPASPIPHDGGQVGTPPAPARPAGRGALDACAQAPAPACLARLEQQVAEGAYALALPLAERLLAADPSYRPRVAPLLVKATAGLASAALAAGRPAEALPWLDRALSAVGDEATLLLLSARAYRALGNLTNARYYYERAVRFDPTLAGQVAKELQGLILEQVAQLRARGETDSALALLTEAGQRYPGDAEYPRVLAELQLERGEVDAAAAALDRALALGDEGAFALALRVSEAQRARAEQDVTRIPVEARGGVLYLAVRVNDQATPLRFVLDTGASHTAISSRVASSLGVQPLAGALPLSVSTASGRALALPTVLRSVAVSDLRVEDVPALILDGLNEVDGLLGLSFLQRFRMEIHADAGYVTLRRR